MMMNTMMMMMMMMMMRAKECEMRAVKTGSYDYNTHIRQSRWRARR
jgi:hypothetical protein